jgi:hypothetical protein
MTGCYLATSRSINSGKHSFNSFGTKSFLTISMEHQDHQVNLSLKKRAVLQNQLCPKKMVTPRKNRKI